MKAKITFTFFLLLVLYAAVAVKAFYVQVLNRDKLLTYSHSQVVREVKTYPRRGFILDRNGAPLAINVQKFNLFTFGKDLKRLRKELSILQKNVPNINASQVYSEVKKRKKFTWISRRIELDEKTVEAFRDFEEIYVEAQPARTYPNNELLSQVLGFTGMDNEGMAGVEYFFNEELKGEAQIQKYFKDAKGRPVKLKSAIVETKAQDITLSVDKDIQASLEEFLKQGVINHEADMGGAAVMDAETGEVWAIANYPTYDPNNVKPQDRNNIKLSYVTDPFESGSVFKTFTIASGLENKLIKTDTNYYCEKGRLKIGKHYVTESDSNDKYEWLSVKDILRKSSNIGTTKIAFDITYPTLRKTIDDFVLADKTDIELPGESRGILDDGRISEIKLSNISFGQGIANTGIQILAAYAAIANGGKYVKPTILKVEKEKSKVKKKRRVISENIANELTQMLVEAVHNGTGKNAIVEHFTVAGKTSTAQRASENGGYSGYISGFVGFPVDVERRFVVYVYIDNPKKGYYGNAVAAPIFKKIVKNILFKRKEYNKVAQAMSVAGVKKNDFIRIRQSSRLPFDKDSVPDLMGLDKSSVKKILEPHDVNYTQTGFGVVWKQYPKPGEKMTEGTVIRLDYKVPSYE